MKMNIISTGQKMPCHQYKNCNGTIVDIDDSGVVVRVFMATPTEKEIQQFSAGSPLKIKLVSMRNIIFFLLKFGSLPWSDAPYSVHLSRNLNHLQNPADGYAMTIMLIDSASEKLISQRIYGMSHRESEILYKMVEEQRQKIFTGMFDYNSAINDIYRTYSTKDLLKFAR